MMFQEPNREEFEKVCEDLKHNVPLNLLHLGRIFGEDFWSVLVLALCDARQAALVLDTMVKNNELAK